MSGEIFGRTMEISILVFSFMLPMAFVGTMVVITAAIREMCAFLESRRELRNMRLAESLDKAAIVENRWFNKKDGV